MSFLPFRPIHGIPCKKTENKIKKNVYTFFKSNRCNDLKWMLNEDGQTAIQTIPNVDYVPSGDTTLSNSSSSPSLSASSEESVNGQDHSRRARPRRSAAD